MSDIYPSGVDPYTRREEALANALGIDAYDVRRMQQDQVTVTPDFELEPPRGDLKWAAIDLDGTLAEGVWTPDDPTAAIGPIRPGEGQGR